MGSDGVFVCLLPIVPRTGEYTPVRAGTQLGEIILSHLIETITRLQRNAGEIPEYIAAFLYDEGEQLFDGDAISEVLLPFVGDFACFSCESEDNVGDGGITACPCFGIDCCAISGALIG